MRFEISASANRNTTDYVKVDITMGLGIYFKYMLPCNAPLRVEKGIQVHMALSKNIGKVSIYQKGRRLKK